MCNWLAGNKDEMQSLQVVAALPLDILLESEKMVDTMQGWLLTSWTKQQQELAARFSDILPPTSLLESAAIYNEESKMKVLTSAIQKLQEMRLMRSSAEVLSAAKLYEQQIKALPPGFCEALTNIRRVARKAICIEWAAQEIHRFKSVEQKTPTGMIELVSTIRSQLKLKGCGDGGNLIALPPALKDILSKLLSAGHVQLQSLKAQKESQAQEEFTSYFTIYTSTIHIFT